MHFPFVPFNSVRFMLVLTQCTEDNPPGCQATATQTSVVIRKTVETCGKNRKSCSLGNNLFFLSEYSLMPKWPAHFFSALIITQWENSFEILCTAENTSFKASKHRIRWTFRDPSAKKTKLETRDLGITTQSIVMFTQHDRWRWESMERKIYGDRSKRS